MKSPRRFSILLLVSLTISFCGSTNESFAQLVSTGNQFWNQGVSGIMGAAEADDQLGSSVAEGDFDGDGFKDLAIGVPLENVGTISNAGSVNVIYGINGGLTDVANQLWNQNSLGIEGVAEEGDWFGFSLAAGDFNGDGYDDLAIGVPYENSDIAGGAVNVLYGVHYVGLTDYGNQLWDGGSPGIESGYGVFGYSLAAGDFNGDGYDDLAIGVPENDPNLIPNAGAVNVLYGSFSAGGLTADGSQVWDQDQLQGNAGGFELFGFSLAAGNFNGDGYDDLAIGVPYEDVLVSVDAGAVNVIYGSATNLTSSGNQFWNQNSTSILNIAEINDQFGYSLAAGDFDGDGVDDLAIGVPYEDVSLSVDAGAVNVIYGFPLLGLTALGNQFWTQNSTGILNTAEGGDQFGLSLATGDFDGDGHDDLAIGVPFEDLSSNAIGDAGAVNVIYGSATSLSSAGNQFWSQNSVGILNLAEANDRFGSSLVTGDFDGDGHDDLAIGVPFEDLNSNTIIDAGAVNVIYGSATGQFPKEEAEGLNDGDNPVEFSLRGNYPNPFNPSTTIAYSIGEVGPVRLAVYNTLGQLVATLVDNPSHPAGEFTVTFNASDLASGVYLTRLETPGATLVRKMMLVK